MRRVKRSLKLPRLEKPTSMQTSVTEWWPNREQAFGPIQARLNPELVRREAEHRLELPDEVKRRDTDLARHVLDRDRRLRHLHQQVSSPAQASERVVSQQHRNLQLKPSHR